MSTSPWMNDYYAKQKSAAEGGKKYLLGLIPELKAAGVTRLAAHYDGSGDEGYFTEVTLYNKTTKIDGPLNEEAVKDAAGDVLESVHGGWEINEGSFGDVVLLVNEAKVVIEHNQRFESSDYDETEV